MVTEQEARGHVKTAAVIAGKVKIGATHSRIATDLRNQPAFFAMLYANSSGASKNFDGYMLFRSSPIRDNVVKEASFKLSSLQESDHFN